MTAAELAPVPPPCAEDPARSVFERVLDILSELPAIGKNSQAPGSMGGYSFRGIEDITAALKPLLAKHGVFMAPTVPERNESVRTTGNNKALYVVDLKVRFTFRGPDGDEFHAEAWGQGSDSGDKATQKAMTSAFKSMLSITFCISDSEHDAERHDVPDTAPPRSQPARKDRIDLVVAAVKLHDLAAWVKDQGFPWPYTDAACDAIESKVDDLLREPM